MVEPQETVFTSPAVSTFPTNQTRQKTPYSSGVAHAGTTPDMPRRTAWPQLLLVLLANIRLDVKESCCAP
jgi:hypothetical protein